MIETKSVNLNISKSSRFEQKMGKIFVDMLKILGYGFFFLLFNLLFTDSNDGIYYYGSIAIFIICLIAAVIYYIKYQGAKKDFKETVNEEKNTPMKRVAFSTAKRDIKGLVVSKEIMDGKANQLLILDHGSRKLYHITKSDNYMQEFLKYKIIPYSEIIQAGVTVDESLVSKSSVGRTVGGYIIGGAVGGTAGAIVGGTNAKKNIDKKVNKIELRIVINDKNNPNIIFRLNDGEIKDSNRVERLIDTAEEWSSVLDLIIKEENEKREDETFIQKEEAAHVKQSERLYNQFDKTTSKDKIEMLKELESLRSSNTLSEEEFDKMKQKILED